MLRHANMAITADTYTTVLQESQSALADGMASVVPPPRSSEALAPTSLPHPDPDLDPHESAAWP
jgi:hypothetical protein